MSYALTVSQPLANTTVPRNFLAKGTFTREGTEELKVRCRIRDSSGVLLKDRTSAALPITTSGTWEVQFQATDFALNYFAASLDAELLDGVNLKATGEVASFNIIQPGGGAAASPTLPEAATE